MSSDVKWIKITTDIFDDEKIMLIESMPDAYAIITVWFKLLCLSGKQNNNGVLMLGRVAYTDEMLATIFRMNKKTVSLALQTFESFGMIEVVEGVITIPNWNKHQSLDALEEKKKRDREYQAKRRMKQREIISLSDDCQTIKSSDVAETSISISNSISKDRESERKETRHQYGEYHNVLLNDTDLSKLKAEFPNDWEQRIEKLSEYMASTGKPYKNHLATIRNWAKRDKKQEEKKDDYWDI